MDTDHVLFSGDQEGAGNGEGRHRDHCREVSGAPRPADRT